MSWWALLLIGVGLTDLVFSVRPMRVVPEVVGAVSALVLGLVCGLTDTGDAVFLLAIAVVVVVWGQTVTRGFARSGRPWVPLAVLAAALAALIVLSGSAPEAGGLADRWLETDPVWLGDRTADELLLLLGVLLVQLSTGNVVVRLVLRATGSRNPSRLGPSTDTGTVDHGQGDAAPLKGGRLLGPMERVLIVGLALAGQVTAASIVIAAKGLLRFPELQAARSDQADIHEVTEYFLVGSFVSWLTALGGAALLLT